MKNEPTIISIKTPLNLASTGHDYEISKQEINEALTQIRRQLLDIRENKSGGECKSNSENSKGRVLAAIPTIFTGGANKAGIEILIQLQDSNGSYSDDLYVVGMRTSGNLYLYKGSLNYNSDRFDASKGTFSISGALNYDNVVNTLSKVDDSRAYIAVKKIVDQLGLVISEGLRNGDVESFIANALSITGQQINFSDKANDIHDWKQTAETIFEQIREANSGVLALPDRIIHQYPMSVLILFLQWIGAQFTHRPKLSGIETQNDDGTEFRVLLSDGIKLFNFIQGSDKIMAGGGWCTGSGDVLTLADINGDYKFDLICGGKNGSNYALISDGSTVMSHYLDNSGLIPMVGSTCNLNDAIGMWADFDGDGRPDYICNFNAGYYGVFVNRGGCGFVSPNNTPDGNPFNFFLSQGWCGKNAGSATWVDFNGDGKVDLICNNKNGQHYVLVSNGIKVDSPNNDRNGFLINNNCAPKETTWADFNGDGKADLICDRENGEHYVLVSNGTNVHSPNNNWNGFLINNGCVSKETTWADFNGDGKADLICDQVDGKHYVLVSNGINVDSPNNDSNGLLINNYCVPKETTWADFNGDGKADLICDQQAGDYKHYVLVSNGTNVHNPNNGLLIQNWCAGGKVTWADFNGDTNMDALCYYGRNVLLNTETPHYHEDL